MNKMLSEQAYKELHDFFFRVLPKKTTLDPLRICALHEQYVYGNLSKAELAKIIEENERKV